MLYKCSSENSRIDKTNFLGSPLPITDAHVKGVFNVTNPEIVISYPGDLSGYNYAACVVNGETYYYYATISGDIGHQLRASLKRDPLMSFKTGVLALPVLGARCEQSAIEAGQIGYNSMIVDPQQPFLAPIDIQRKELASFSWDPYYTLVTVG